MKVIYTNTVFEDYVSSENIYILLGYYVSNDDEAPPRARRSDAATSNKDKRIFFMLMPRTWFKVEEFRLE